MKVLIIEDEIPALTRVKKMLLEVEPRTVIVGTADSIESAITLIRKHPQADVILMDIELADGQSFEIFSRIAVTSPVIFTTAYDEFALKAFKVNSIDYLLKPIDKDELQKAIAKLKVLKRVQDVPDYKEQLQQILSNFNVTTQPQYKSRFLIKVGTKMLSVPADQIAYFHAADKLVYLYTMHGQKHIIDYTLDELMRVLHPNHFFQLNRQFVANVKSIHSVHSYFNGKLKVDLTPRFSEEVIISRERAAEFKMWLDL
jgi:two-component system LytT family response regulator